MTDDLPAEPVATGVEYLTGFSFDPVILHGRKVPYLEGRPRPGGMVTLTLDRRWEIDLPADYAEIVTCFVADAIAVALGYACHPRDENKAIKSDPFGAVWRGVETA